MSMSFVDKGLKCRDCGEEFVFTAGEQEFYQERGFTNEPTRCKPCRDTKKRERGGGGGGSSSGPREMHTAVCDECGVETQVPFQPRGDRPVYCRECFQSQRRY